MRYLSPALVLMGALILQAPAAYATPMTFVGNLSGANEVAPVVSPAGGFAGYRPLAVIPARSSAVILLQH